MCPAPAPGGRAHIRRKTRRATPANAHGADPKHLNFGREAAFITAASSRPSAAARASSRVSSAPNTSHSPIRTTCRAAPSRLSCSNRAFAFVTSSVAVSTEGKLLLERSIRARRPEIRVSAAKRIPLMASARMDPSRSPRRWASASVLSRVTCRGLWFPGGAVEIDYRARLRKCEAAEGAPRKRRKVAADHR